MSDHPWLKVVIAVVINPQWLGAIETRLLQAPSAYQPSALEARTHARWPGRQLQPRPIDAKVGACDHGAAEGSVPCG
eukprot:6486007-Amphidinium_carterae.1